MKMVQHALTEYGAQMRRGRGAVAVHYGSTSRRDSSSSRGKTQFLRRFFGLRDARWALW
jgi:hypothetical protein